VSLVVGVDSYLAISSYPPRQLVKYPPLLQVCSALSSCVQLYVSNGHLTGYGSGVRHELSSLARTPGPWIRIPLRAWMLMFVLCIRFSVFATS
jgi:hypothetical protein